MATDEEIASKSSHFFRIILPSILQNGTLELPLAFVKEHGASLSEYVALKLPTGAKSKIELRICDDRAWLHKGWRDFVKKYSIKCGYFLVFKYKGESRFNLLIFDLTTSEIEYPVPSARTRNEKAEKRKLIEVKKEDCDVKDDDILDESPHKLQKGTRTLRSGRLFAAFRGKGVKDTSAREIVLERAKSFQSPNPHFIVMMGSSYITRGSMLVPVNARRYFHGRDDNGVKVNGPDGRAWLMEYHVAGPSRSHEVNIVSRWKGFVKEYNLRVGDACVFERVDDKILTFNVVVFRIAIEEDDGRENAAEEYDGRRTRSQKKLRDFVLDV